MSTPQVGQGAVAIFPTFKGFRKGVTGEVDATTRESTQRFSKGFQSAGTTAGKTFSEGFKKQTSNVSGDILKKATDDVAKATRELSAVRLKEQDALGKQRVAEAQLADARRRYADDSVQVVRAQERLAAAQRQVDSVQESVENSTERLARAQRELADSSAAAAAGGGRFRRVFSNLGGESASAFGDRFRTGVGAIFTGNLLADIAFSGGRLIGQGLAAGARFGFDGIGLASDLAESVNAVTVSFGDDVSAQLQALAQDAPSRLALTRRSFLQFATQFSAFARTIRRDNPAAFIDELTERGADFASVFNLEVADALQLFQSGLAGETEPLRRYGLNLSAAAVESFAYANGIAEAGRALTETEKVQARYGLLLQQTAGVQGDNANTAGELAGQQRRLAAAFEEAQTKLGEKLLPGFLDLVTLGNEKILPVFGDIVERVGPKLGEALGAVDWEELADAVAPVVEDFAILAAEEGIPALTDAVKDFAAAAPEWIDAWRFLNDPNAQPAKFFNDFIGSGQAINQWLRDELGIVLEGGNVYFGEAGQRYMESLQAGIEDNLGGPQAAVSAALRGANAAALRETSIGARRGGGGSFDAGVSLGDGLAGGIESSGSKVNAAASRLARGVVGAIRTELEIRSPSRVMEQLGEYSGDGLVKGLRSRESAVAAAASLLAGVVPVAGTGAAGGSSAAPAGPSGGVRDIILQNPDPTTLMAMLMQELDSRLRVGG